MNLEKYKSTVEYPSKIYEYYVYDKGEVIHKFTSHKQLEDYKASLGSRLHVAKVCSQHVCVNEEEYNTQRKAYYAESKLLLESFTQDLFKEYGVEDHPKRDLLYAMSCEYADSSGFSDIESTFSCLVELIK